MKQEIIDFLKDNIEPLDDEYYSAGYRVAAYLTDGTYLPCVVFRNLNAVEVANKKLTKYRNDYKIKHYTKSLNGKYIRYSPRKNYVNDYCIAGVEKSKYAFPVSIVKQIQGETRMGWTAFAAKMKDGRYFGFGTAGGKEFFHMPENYSVEEIDTIINHSWVSKTGELRSYANFHDFDDSICYEGRPSFECYLVDL